MRTRCKFTMHLSNWIRRLELELSAYLEHLQGAFVYGCDYGVSALNTSNVRVSNVVFSNQGGAAGAVIQANDASIVREQNNQFIFLPAAGAISSGVSATMIAQSWQTWTPVFSTDVGNAATSFASITSNLARISRTGNVVTVTVNYSGQFNAITASQVRVGLPAWVSVANSNLQSPASVYNNTAYETGIARSVSGTDLIIVYRANGANYTSGAAFEGRFSLTFEANN